MFPRDCDWMKNIMAKNWIAGWVAVLAVCVCCGAAVAQEREVLARGDWPEVRTGESVAGIAALQAIMIQFEAAREPVIQIRFPGGNLGNAWAFELRDWLVALGVPSERVQLEPGSGMPDAMTLAVFDQG